MKNLAKLISMLGMLLILGACAIPKPVHVGDTEAQVLAARGTPTHRYSVGNEQLLEYMTGPYGQKTYMARLGPDGKLISFEQVLTDEKFGAIQIGISTKDDVLRLVGGPSEETYFPLSKLLAWTYPYKQYEVWDSLMHVHFDNSGIVRKLEVTPDYRYRRELIGPGRF
jgi:hypothetical protein